MKSLLIRAVCVTPALLGGLAHATGNWETVTVETIEYDVTVGAEVRTIAPSCQVNPETYQREPYAFHFKGGKTDKLVIYFNGGGGCWDKSTCVDSLSTNLPTWVPTVTVANNPEEMGGILGLDDSNPYADWSMLFVSYCTGDIHAGSAEQFYGGVPIFHKGFDNFLYAMDWLKTNHPEIDPKKILVSGSSAGAYGAGLNYPWVLEFYPYADKVFLLGDGGFGVFDSFSPKDTSAFSNAVFGQASVWGLRDTVHPDLATVPDEVLNFPGNFIPEVYGRLATAYPKEKFAQYTTAYDVVQILFWDIMLNPESPSDWGGGLFNPFLASEFIPAWNENMNSTDLWLQSYIPSNYRSYIDSGCVHTILRDDDAFYASRLESSSDEIRFLDWLLGMTGEKTTDNRKADKEDWQNLSCAENGNNCEYPDPKTELGLWQIGTCLDQALPTQ